jgi:HEPN domain-containing protein
MRSRAWRSYMAAASAPLTGEKLRVIIPFACLATPLQAHTANWLDLSAYDLEAAEELLDSRRYVYAVFMCHLAAEKLLKAAVVEFAGQDPLPRIHALKRPAEIAGLALSDEPLEFLVELTDRQQRARYPEDIETLGRIYTSENTRARARQTREFRTWLEPQIRSGQP